MGPHMSRFRIVITVNPPAHALIIPEVTKIMALSILHLNVDFVGVAPYIAYVLDGRREGAGDRHSSGQADRGDGRGIDALAEVLALGVAVVGLVEAGGHGGAGDDADDGGEDGDEEFHVDGDGAIYGTMP
mmetsp:Transcript_7098/g.16387  ORF Transcript_7098/g.16387 Transcript_7098/m.16387 type:complete len:130 (+) Transcript_7098:370-759(+)